MSPQNLCKFLSSILMLCTFSEAATAQNLVPNPSFEDTIECPSLLNEIYKINNWEVYKGSPDAFNECTYWNNSVGVPDNVWGHQEAYHGSGYVGMYIMQLPFVDSREMVGCELISPLVVGETYHVSMQISKVDHSNVNTATNAMGIRFLTEPHDFLNPVPLDNFAHIKSDSILADTSDWFKIQGLFTPDTAFQYLAIGNFFTDDNTDTIHAYPGQGVGYYLVDDVQVKVASDVGIKQGNKKTGLKLYPNPVRDKLYVQGEHLSQMESLSIYDQVGREVKLMNGNVITDGIDVQLLSPGLYFVLITLESGEQLQESFVK